MSTAVHHASMYAYRLASAVTQGAPATFNGTAPTTLAELQTFDGGDAWDPENYVILGNNTRWTWDGTEWVAWVDPND